MLKQLARDLGRRLANFLNQPLKQYERRAVIDEEEYRAILKPGDVILIEGNRRVSAAIKYLTQSTWSHACIYIGDVLHGRPGEERRELIEVDIEHGVIAVPIRKYINHNTRIARPVGLSKNDQRRLIEFVVSHLGHKYDLKNIFDLVRYLLPEPPIPARYRRRLLGIGSGDPTRAICSTLLAKAFQTIKYPILPRLGVESHDGDVTEEQVLRARHYRHFTPRDFDLSPYFAVIKPMLQRPFDYTQIKWLQDEPADSPDGVSAVTVND